MRLAGKLLRVLPTIRPIPGFDPSASTTCPKAAPLSNGRSPRYLALMRFLPLFALALVAAPPALACSPVPGYRVPTNIELVSQADLILLATVSDGDFEPDSTATQQIAIAPVAALKGTMPAGPLALSAMIASDADAMPSNPYELSEAHPQAYGGSCTRYAFPRGSRVLFFLDREDGFWREAGGPFSRWAEDVLTDDAPWLTLVRFYIEVAALPEAERIAALTAKRNAYGAQGDDPVAQLMAADITRQLAGPNEPLREEFGFSGTEIDTGVAPEPKSAAEIEGMADAVMEAAEAAAAAARAD